MLCGKDLLFLIFRIGILFLQIGLARSDGLFLGFSIVRLSWWIRLRRGI